MRTLTLYAASSKIARQLSQHQSSNLFQHDFLEVKEGAHCLFLQHVLEKDLFLDAFPRIVKI